MQVPNMEDEESDFSLNSAARSRLSSLFQGENASGDVNQALTFQAPKQPRKNDNAQASSETFKLIHASAVHAYKLIEGNYANQGKLGCAILGLHESASYRFLLYKGKQIQVTSCSIVPSFKFHVQPNNYVNFYDEKNENWSINFDSETALTEFAKQIALAKANSEGKSQSSLIIQDLELGVGPSLDIGDSAEVKYTGWLLLNYSFGQIFDSNVKSESAFRLRLGKSKVIKGWSEGLVGAQKGGKRLLVIPPSLAYGSEGMGPSVPPNSTLIFEVLVTKVKISRDSSHSPSPIKILDNVPEKRPEVLPRSSISQEDNIRMRGASISEQLSQSPKKDKAQLISRMAKMGTATLPLQGAIPAQVSSESENEEETQNETPSVQLSESRTASPKPFSKHSSRHSSVSSAVVQPVQSHPVQESIPLQVTQHSSQISLYSQAALPPQQAYMGPTAYPPYQQQLSSPFHVPQSQFQMQSIPGMMPPTSIADTHLPLLITETRSQNTEVRLSLSKIADKVDTVIQKVDDLRFQQGRGSGMSHTPYMDSILLVQNIERIVQENKQLKEDAEAKNTKIQSLNEKVCDLLQRNQRFFEESNSMLEQRSDSIQAVSAQSQVKLMTLEKEKVKLSSDLSDALSKLTSTEVELSQYQSRESQLKQRLLEFEKVENQSRDSNVTKDSMVNSLRDQVRNLNHENNTLMVNLEELQKQYKELTESKAFLIKHQEENEQKIEEISSKAALKLREMKEFYNKEILDYQQTLKQAESTASNADSSSNDKRNSEIELLVNEKENILKEKDELLSETAELKRRLRSFETSEVTHKQQLSHLQTELEKSLSWKKKYEIFYEKTRAMKDRYENQIVELMAEVKRSQAVGSVSTDFSGEIKKVMNALYKQLQGKFEPNVSYPGPKVLEMTLLTIKGLTFQLLQIKSRSSSGSSEQDTEAGKQSKESVSNINSNAAEQLSVEESISNTSDKDVNQTEDLVQQNGLEDAEPKVKENPSVSKVSEKVESASGVVDHSKSDDGCDSENLGMASNVGVNVADSNCTENDLDASKSNSVPETRKLEEPSTIQKDSKEIAPVQDEERASPDSSHCPSSTNVAADLLSETVGSKIWKPQPPPLFDDDDDDDEDNDDWLK